LTLRDSEHNIIGIQTTGSDGIYLFDNLALGEYFLTETNPPGYASTTPDAWGISLPDCSDVIINFGDEPVGAPVCIRTVTGVVWDDRDGDGIMDADESPLANATVTLRDSNYNVVATYITGPDGVYVFTNLAPDSYIITETNPPGYPISTTLDNWGVDLHSCITVEINFGDQRSRLYIIYLPLVMKK